MRVRRAGFIVYLTFASFCLAAPAVPAAPVELSPIEASIAQRWLYAFAVEDWSATRGMMTSSARKTLSDGDLREAKKGIVGPYVSLFIEGAPYATEERFIVICLELHSRARIHFLLGEDRRVVFMSIVDEAPDSHSEYEVRRPASDADVLKVTRILSALEYGQPFPASVVDKRFSQVFGQTPRRRQVRTVDTDADVRRAWRWTHKRVFVVHAVRFGLQRFLAAVAVEDDKAVKQFYFSPLTEDSSEREAAETAMIIETRVRRKLSAARASIALSESRLTRLPCGDNVCNPTSEVQELFKQAQLEISQSISEPAAAPLRDALAQQIGALAGEDITAWLASGKKIRLVADKAGTVDTRRVKRLIGAVLQLLDRLLSLPKLAPTIDITSSPDRAEFRIQVGDGTLSRRYALTNAKLPDVWRGLYKGTVTKPGFKAAVVELDLLNDLRTRVSCVLFRPEQSDASFCRIED